MVLKAVQIRGAYNGASGYDHHTREYARELVRQGVHVQLGELETWGRTPVLQPGIYDPWFEEWNKPNNARIVLHMCPPNHVEPVPGKINVNHTMFEATRIPREWAESHVRCDAIVLPTESSRRAWIASGVPAEKLWLVPLGVDAHRFAPDVEALDLGTVRGKPVSEYRTRLLNVSQLTPRKNVWGLARLWLETTSEFDDAILILKLGPNTPERLQRFHDQLPAMAEEVGTTLNEAAPILVLPEMLPEADMAPLFTAATHYISISRGEGWDLGMMQAASAELRLIAPGHSAYPAYLERSTAVLLPYREETITAPDIRKWLPPTARWWQPDRVAVMVAIRAAINGIEEPKLSLRERILSEFTWPRVTTRLIEVLSEIEHPIRRSFSFLRRTHSARR